MAERSVILKVEMGDFNGLLALARVDKNLVGDQMRIAIKEYLEKRKEEVQKELEVVEKERKDILNALLDGIKEFTKESLSSQRNKPLDDDEDAKGK